MYPPLRSAGHRCSSEPAYSVAHPRPPKRQPRLAFSGEAEVGATPAKASLLGGPCHRTFSFNHIVNIPVDSALAGHSIASSGCYCHEAALVPKCLAIGLQPLVCGEPTIPRTADRFALVRYAELHAQTTTPSRTATVSGASPVFALSNPLSGALLKPPCSVHFQDFHPLQGLGRSCAHNALAGNFTLLLQATRRTSGSDPVHPPLLCMPLCRFRLCFVHARVLRR